MFGWHDGIYLKSVRAAYRHIGTQAMRQIIHYPPQQARKTASWLKIKIRLAKVKSAARKSAVCKIHSSHNHAVPLVHKSQFENRTTQPAQNHALQKARRVASLQNRAS
ncbi:hypothetical protein [Campylobacter sp.]|uniref:hypothetical protein n=1 Tax=Campylobacter sp. TaxID=205 RepID=UPI0027B8B1A7|nr:hypothetical protein [Campylobacter sp.]